MKKQTLLLAVAGLVLSFVTTVGAAERVRVTTNLGAFVIELQRDRAPLTVENFLGYVRSGYYTNTQFHRVIANFVVQGGGVGPDYKAKPVNKPIANEAGNGLKNLRGTVGLARASGAHSGDCQFYVNVADNADLDPLPTRWGYAVFGRVVEGMEVVDRISVSPTGSAGPFKQDAPLQQVLILKVELLAEAPAPTPVKPPLTNPAPPETAPATPLPSETTPAGEAPRVPSEQPASPPAQDSPPPQ
jgi:cyclophilin family peptidyl-prolyl cis-trans isomerase